MSTLVAALPYTRVSDDDQADADTLAALGKTAKKAGRNGMSLATQLAEVRRYITYHPDWVIQEEYTDVLSGKRADRPGYQALLAEAKRLRAEGRRVAVVVAALDRFGRSVRERVDCWEALTPLGVEFHSVREGGLQQEWMYNMLAGLAQEESRRLGERVAKVRQHMRDGGFKAPGRAALGYGWREATDDERRQGAPVSVLIPDPERAPVAREAFERAAGGASVRSVARWISSLPDDVRGGRRMTFRAVQLMLAAPVYAARPDEGDDDVLSRPVGRWEPLVSDEVWQAVQDHVASHRRAPRQASGKYLLTGLIRCPCGQRMHGASSPQGQRRKDGTKAVYRSYRCERATVGVVNDEVEDCRVHFSANLLDRLAEERIAPLIALASADAELRAAVRREWRAMQQREAPDPGLRSRIAYLERAADKARTRLRNAGLLLADGTMTKRDYQDLRETVEHDLTGAEKEIERLQADRPATPTLPDVETVFRMIDGWAETWRDGDVTARREIVLALVERIDPRKVGRGEYDAEIAWSVVGRALRKLTRVAA